MLFLIMEIIVFRGDLTDVSAFRKTMVVITQCEGSEEDTDSRGGQL